MANKVQHNKKALLDALEKHLGVVSSACKEIGINRSTYYDYYNNDQEFKNAVDDLSNVALDFAESKLFEKINGVTVSNGTDENDNQLVYKQPPSDTALIFYLKTKGKKRGYIEKIETENKHTIEGAIIDWSESNTTDQKAN